MTRFHHLRLSLFGTPFRPSTLRPGMPFSPIFPTVFAKRAGGSGSIRHAVAKIVAYSTSLFLFHRTRFKFELQYPSHAWYPIEQVFGDSLESATETLDLMASIAVPDVPARICIGWSEHSLINLFSNSDSSRIPHPPLPARAVRPNR